MVDYFFLVNPITSNMAKYYEKVKANYSRDVDHLINFKRDGLWIKEKLENKQRFIYSKKIENDFLNDVTIIHLDDKSNFLEKLVAKKAYIKKNEWTLYNVNIIKLKEGMAVKTYDEQYNIISIYNLNKINNLFKNFDTMSFMDLIYNFEKLLDIGYGKRFLDQSLHSLLTLPFFLFLMTSIAAVLALSNLNKRNNLWMTVVGLIVVIIVYYLKDFSLALGQIDKIPLILSIWAPIIALCLFTFIGVIQINEK